MHIHDRTNIFINFTFFKGIGNPKFKMYFLLIIMSLNEVQKRIWRMFKLLFFILSLHYIYFICQQKHIILNNACSNSSVCASVHENKIIPQSCVAGFEPLTWLINTPCYEHRYVGVAFKCNKKYKAYFSNWLFREMVQQLSPWEKKILWNTN